MKPKKIRLSARTERTLRAWSEESPVFGAKTMIFRMRVSPDQKDAILADAKALGVSATELLLQLHRVASPSLRGKKRR